MDIFETNNGELISRLADVSDEMSKLKNIHTFTQQAVTNVCHLLQATRASFMLFDWKTLEFVFEKRTWELSENPSQPRIEINENLPYLLHEGGEILSFIFQEQQRFVVLYDPIESHRYSYEIRIPCALADRHIGVLSLGPKESGIDYTAVEIDSLRVFTNFLSLSCSQLDLYPQEKDKKGAGNFQRNGEITHPVVLQPHILKKSEKGTDILSESPAMKEITELVDRIALEDVTILITGESGTGKELIARAIHQKSRRNNRPLVAMNCAALPDSLVESELFGFEKGAFTGAASQRKGKFEFADGSSLFLDEIGDMSLQTQAKLLRVLQDGTFQRVGGNQTLYSDVRLIAATNKDLCQCIKNGEFREDLYYRINVVQIQIPPLRERKEDVKVLALYYFDHFCRIYKRHLLRIHDSAMEWLLTYGFPGECSRVEKYY